MSNLSKKIFSLFGIGSIVDSIFVKLIKTTNEKNIFFIFYFNCSLM